MRTIAEIAMYYIGIGLIGAILVGKATERYYDEIEEELGDKIDPVGIKALMVVTIFTWPKKLIWLVKFIVTGMTAYIREQQKQEG